MLKLEKNIPIPSTAGRPKKYPFEKMQHGDSFLVTPKEKTSVRQCIVRENKRSTTHKWITRSVDNGIRVWCVEK